MKNVDWKELEKRTLENFASVKRLEDKILKRHGVASVQELYAKLEKSQKEAK